MSTEPISFSTLVCSLVNYHQVCFYFWCHFFHRQLCLTVESYYFIHIMINGMVDYTKVTLELAVLWLQWLWMPKCWQSISKQSSGYVGYYTDFSTLTGSYIPKERPKPVFCKFAICVIKLWNRIADDPIFAWWDSTMNIPYC